MFSAKLKNHIIKLHQKKYRDEFGEFLVEGLKGVSEALSSSAKTISVMIENEYAEKTEAKKFINDLENKDIQIFYINTSDAKKIKTTKTFPGILAVIEIPKYDISSLVTTEPIIALDSISDPGNLGTIIRTADWFNLNNILISENSVDPYNEKVVRSTMGSIFRTKIVESTDIVQSVSELKKKGYKVIALDKEGKDIDELKLEKKTIYILGSESHGTGSNLLNLADKRCTIKGAGESESLNVAIAAGILMSKI